MPASQQIAARYFGMWNTGASWIAVEILSPGCAIQSGLRLHIEAISATVMAEMWTYHGTSK
jgi:hypothetical protein